MRTPKIWVALIEQISYDLPTQTDGSRESGIDVSFGRKKEEINLSCAKLLGGKLFCVSVLISPRNSKELGLRQPPGVIGLIILIQNALFSPKFVSKFKVYIAILQLQILGSCGYWLSCGIFLT